MHGHEDSPAMNSRGGKRNEELEKQFGAVVRRHRLEKGLSQEALADLCNLHRTYVSDVERGLKAASLRSLLSIARALDLPLHVLIREAEEDDA